MICCPGPRAASLREGPLSPHNPRTRLALVSSPGARIDTAIVGDRGAFAAQLAVAGPALMISTYPRQLQAKRDGRSCQEIDIDNSFITRPSQLPESESTEIGAFDSSPDSHPFRIVADPIEKALLKGNVTAKKENQRKFKFGGETTKIQIYHPAEASRISQKEKLEVTPPQCQGHELLDQAGPDPKSACQLHALFCRPH
jgi:hypothetical protein